MDYSKLQKTIASFLLPLFFFGLVFRFPFGSFFGGVQAGSTKIYSLVSILVNSDVYPGVKDSVERYARDIQNQLENTRVVIIPMPKDATAFEIASLNENLYYEGYAGLVGKKQFESKLVGSVFIGDIPAPIVHDGEKAAKTILPYIDFEDKKYIYNHKNQRYEKNVNNLDGGKIDIWHGLIVPNKSGTVEDIRAINDFFDKDHDFYEGQGNFQKSKAIINAKQGEKVHNNYKPYVFYFDEFREESGLSYAKYKGYEAYLENKEDLTYSRYSKELADKIQKKVLGEEKDQIRDLIKDLDPDLDLDALSSGPDISKTSAISTRVITEKVAKKFLEVINSSTLGDFRKDVYNAGRYNGTGSKVNVDTVPYLISVLDAVGDEVLKGVNNHLELKIDKLVEGGFSRDIALPTFLNTKGEEENKKNGGLSQVIERENENILYGQTSSGITEAYQCSFYRGASKDGGTLVAANRGFNIRHIKDDIDKCGRADTLGYWGGNSPVNLDLDKIGEGEFILKKSVPRKAIEPLFDIIGGKIEKDSKWIPSPMNCMRPNYLTIKKIMPSYGFYEEGNGWDIFGNKEDKSYTLPLHERRRINWDCKSENEIYDYFRTFDETYKEFHETSSGSVEAKGDILISFSGSSSAESGGPITVKLEFAGTGTVFVRGKGKVRYDFDGTGTLDYNHQGVQDINGSGKQKIEEDIINTFDFTGTGSFNLQGIRSPNTSGFGKYEAKEGESCNYKVIYLEDELIRGFQGLDGQSLFVSGGDEGFDEDSVCKPSTKIFHYKKIPSILIHKSPTVAELYPQVKSVMSPDLPIDKDRYVDFISAAGKHVQIKYPYLFRLNDIGVGKSGDFSKDFDIVIDNLDVFLDKKSSEINKKINENNPSSLLGEELEIYNYLKHGDYPDADFNLKEYLKSKLVKSFEINGDSKNISYYDTLAFAIFWNNLRSVPQKYKFVFEHYLTDQFRGDEQFALPKHKKVYEIAYLGAPGDAQNMYVTLDPESKGENPYADIVSDNLDINANLLGSNVFGEEQLNENDKKGIFKCAPPEGVPIWKWIPAVVCWLKDMLPPKIKIGKAKCTTKTLFEDDEKEKNFYDFGQNSHGEEDGFCSEDGDSNGISDCLEQEISDATLQLKSSTQKSGYGKNIILESALFDSEGFVISGVNNIHTKFELVKIEAPKDSTKELIAGNIEVIYDNTKLNEKSISKANKYISFTNNSSIPLNKGKAQYFFTSKNRDANIYFKTDFVLLDSKGETITELSSNVQKVEIRENTFSLSGFSASNTENNLVEEGSISASEYINLFLFDSHQNNLDEVKQRILNASLSKEKLILGLSNSGKAKAGELNYPLKISYEKDGEQQIEDFIVEKTDLKDFKGLFSIKESGEFTLLITDSSGETLRKHFTVVAGEAVNVDIALGASDIETGGNITTNLFSITDKYGNIVRGQYHDVQLKVVGGGLELLDNNNSGVSTKKISLYDGLKAFRLKSTGKANNNILSLTVKNSIKTLANASKNIRTIQKIVADVTLPSEKIIVGGNTYKLKLILKDSKGDKLSHFNSRVYLQINSIYGSIDTPYTNIENGETEINFTTSDVAGKDIPLEFKVEGLGSTVRKNITIFPGKPMKLDLILSQSKMQADPSAVSTLDVELKDRYNNLVTNDSSTQFTLELKKEYRDVIGVDSGSKKAKNGKATFKLSGTGIPGTAYVKIKTIPDLGSNTFTVGTGKGQITVEGEGVNAIKVQTFYFWNKEHIDGKKYNSIYSVLLGAEYGDFTQKDYLAGSLLFDRDNRSLAVTSLLNNPHVFSDAITLGKNAGIDIVSSKGDLSQNIELKVNFDETNKLYLEAYNNGLSVHIGKLFYNFGSNTLLKTCIGKEKDFSDCNIPDNNTSIILKSFSQHYDISSLNGELTLSEKGGNTLLTIDKNGEFDLNSLINLDIDMNIVQDYLVLNIKSNNSVIGKIAINFEDHEYKVVRSLKDANIEKIQSKNSIILQLSSYMYGTRDIYSGGEGSKAIYYNDPFGDDKALDRFSGNNLFGLENFEKKGGIGWSGENKFLLSFAAGKTVGESVQDYASFGTLTLGDPVISLKKIKKKFKKEKEIDIDEFKSFDSSIGKLLSTDDDIDGYRIFDYDNDDRQDIILIKSDGYIKLLENKKGSTYFIDKGNLSYIADYGNSSYIQAGDFAGDGFDDIFFVNNKGEPFLLNNTKKDFERFPLKEQFQLNGKIVQVKSFDMDSDGKMDLITLDDAGDINIFYGGQTEAGPRFTKLEIESGYGIELNSDERNDGGLVYFDELIQLKKEDEYSRLLSQSQEYQDRLDENEDNLDEASEIGEINEPLIDGVVFAQISYSAGAANENNAQSRVLDSIPVLTSDDLGSSAEDTQNALGDLFNSFPDNITISGNSHSSFTTFIRSEYSDSAGIQVKKKFSDRNSKNLQTGDLIDVEVTLKNISGEVKKSVAYVDSITSPFEATQNKIIISKGVQRIAPAGYQILVDGFDLNPGEQMTIKYELQVLPIKFGFIKVGLFEKDEAGDDIYGDVIIKPDNKNCSQDVDIFRSTAARVYDTKKKAPPRCDESKLGLPENLEDLDGNGVPDYLDKLTNGATFEEQFGTGSELDEDGNGIPDYVDAQIKAQQDFGQTALDDMHEDSDGDGIPDHEDDSPYFNNEDGSDNFLDVLDSMNKSVDDISDSVDNLIESFGCGFGGGSCIATPLNWAPLAPGQDPTLFGMPIGDGLRVGEGIPIFSAFTGINIPTPFGCYQIPAFWPASPLTYSGICNGTPGAGGYLGINSPTNFVRLFATPTLTGGFGTAACFGGPASVAGYIPPPGASPVLPGGNCIVYAEPLLKCSNDGNEGDPETLGLADQFGVGENGFGIVNANCSAEQHKSKGGYSSNTQLDGDFLDQYYDYKKDGIQSEKLYSDYKDALDTISKGSVEARANKPLISVNGGGENGEYEFQVSLDFSGNKEGNFTDVIQIQKKRVSPFPSFLMDWATRQIEEIVTKLADFPTLFVILPDFGGLFDTDWKDYISKGLPEAFDKGKQKDKQIKDNLDSKIDSLNASKSGLDCKGKDEIKCLSIDIQAGKITAKKNTPGNETISGVRAVYDFLGNIPLVAVKPQQINVEIPWVDSVTINKTLLNWKLTKQQWLEEVIRVNGSIYGAANASVNYGKLISSLDKNIEILEGYKDIPKKLSKLFNQKEVWLSQILCNVEAISALTGEWIGQNGKRFKAWVELYILIKAILKSWQLLVDVFIDYDAECHECKNERQDLLNFEFKLIDMIIPKIPVIKFPKWPDIILDLHNIRAGLTILMPDFNVTQRPIVLPTLPELHLPSVDGSISVNIELPEVPLLPELNIPDLPDLQSLPTVELPNLPPPPTLPKIFSSLKGILKILKLVIKAMCILKSSPFVPEWRAGDQIAFLTERQGYLPTDFLNLSLPEFSFPFIDAIKVTTWVNLEFEVEFMAEIAKQIVDPINSSTSNIVNKFSNAGLDDLDFSSYSKNIKKSKNIDLEVNAKGMTTGMLAKIFSAGVLQLFSYIDENQSKTVSSKEFLALVNQSLSSHDITSNPRMEKVLKVWDSVNKYTYHKEDMLIKDLQNNSREKFEALNRIIENEITKTQKLEKNIDSLINSKDNLFKKIVGTNQYKDFVKYEKTLSHYNKKFLVSAKNLVNGGEDSENTDIKKQGKKLLTQVRGGLNRYKESLERNIELPKRISSSNYLAADTGTAPTAIGNSCQQANNATFSYNYKGLYVIEKKKSYRLFDYIDELSGDEEYTVIDFDTDGDKDLLYIVNGELFLKENLTIKQPKETVSLPPLKVKISNNRYFNGDDFIEAVNGFKEVNTDNRSINIVFNAPTDTNITNFRYEYYTTVDKFTNEGNASYIPKNISKNIIDGLVSSKDILDEGNDDELFVQRPNFASISYVGSIQGVRLVTPEMINIKDNTKTIISQGTRIYTGKTSANIEYYIGEDEETLTNTLINKGSSLKFKENITILSATGDVFVEGDDTVSLVGNEKISKYIGLPLFPKTHISIIPDFKNKLKGDPHVLEISYPNDPKLSLNFGEIDSYEVYDLGHESSDYLIKLDRPNDFLYGKIHALKDGIIGTMSAQKLAAPQVEADLYAPELNFNGVIRIPVYQKKIIDISAFLYDNSGFKGIQSVTLDFNLGLDSNLDGNPKNDNDTYGVKINHSPSKVTIEFGEFEYLVQKKIGITMIDENHNVGFKEINFEVYAPTPEINTKDEEKIQGVIDEKLLGEPINIYRVRGGQIRQIKDISGKIKVNTKDEGVYNFDVKQQTQSGLTLNYAELEIADINEFTGKITLKNPTSQIRVNTDDGDYPKIVIIGSQGDEQYHEYIKLLSNREITVVDSFNNIEKEGMYLNFIGTQNYEYYSVPTGATYSAGAYVIHKKGDKTKPLFTLFPDGRIRTNSTLYKLGYMTKGDYVGFELISRVGNKKIAEVLLRVKAGYLMK